MDKDIESTENLEKKDDDQQIILADTPGIEHKTLEKVMEDSFFRYSMSVIIDRALPDVRDGLKPVHRRIMYSMDLNGNRSSSKFVKSALIVGDVMGKYHPHGDSAIYNSMVRLAQPWSLRYPLIQGQGNFGSMDGDEAAAMRYTEARMAKLADEMLADIDKDTIDFRDNYDGSRQEPVVLPAKVPNLLLNGQIGIAVGMATNIPPHNLGELVDASVALIDNEDIETDELLQHVKGPDFPTGATIYGGLGMKQAYQTGRGSVTVRGVAGIEESKKGRYKIVITEIPYGVNKATLIEKIAELVKDKKLTGIVDLRDETARGVVRVVVELKKDAYPKKLLNQLYKYTSLQTSFNFNMLALLDGIQPRIMGLKEMLKEFVKHRQKVVRRRTEFELRKAKARAHILEGYKIALDHIDEVIKTIRGSKTQDEAEKNLISKFKLSEIQAKAILAMQLRRLTGLERQAIEDELKELLTLIKKLEMILADENEILKIIKTELLEIKEKYGDGRRSTVINHELGKFSDEELIPDEEVVVTITDENYIKRSLASEYRSQNRGGKGKRGISTKGTDQVKQLVFGSTHTMLLFFTSKGRVFKLKTYEVPASGLNAKGLAIVNLLQLHPDEIVTTMIKMPDDKDSGYLFMSTKCGVVKKTAMSNYMNIRTSGLIAITLDDDDELRWIKHTTGENDVIISTLNGQAIRFHESDVRAMGRNARGVRGIKLRGGDEAIGMDVVNDGDVMFVLSRLGYGKRTSVDQFAVHKRGGMGIKAAIVNSKTGKLMNARALPQDTTDVIIVSNEGQTIRLRLAEIPKLGRTTQGVRIMRLNSDDEVASLALVTSKNDSEDEGE